MKTCPQCGFHHTDLDERCLRCGACLESVSQPDPGGLPRERFKFRGGEVPGWRWALPGRLAAALRRRFFFLGRALESPLPEDVHYRNPWASAWLSVVPGLGQLYNHQPKKALLIFLSVAACLALAVLTFYRPFSNYVLLGYLMAMVYSFHDGLITAKRINHEFFIWQHGIGFYCAWMFYLWIFCILFQYAACHFLVQFRMISDDAMAPFLRKGERVVLWMPGRPKVGDVVLYHPSALSNDLKYMEGDDPVVLHPTSMIERVVAGPGQTFERRGGLFFRDGRQVPLEEQPIVTKFLPGDFKLTAPADAYIILFSYTFSGHDPLYALLGMDAQAPPLAVTWKNENNWHKACTVPRGEITGKVWFVYQPPPTRRKIK